MKQLPESDWKVVRVSNDVIAVAMHENHGYLHWTKATLAGALTDRAEPRTVSKDKIAS